MIWKFPRVEDWLNLLHTWVDTEFSAEKLGPNVASKRNQHSDIAVLQGWFVRKKRSYVTNCLKESFTHHWGEHSVIILWLGNAFPRGKKKRSVNTSATQTECDRKRGTRRILVAPLRNREMGVCRLYRQESMLFSRLNEISLQPLYECFAIPH